MAYTEEELKIIGRVYDSLAPQRNAITSARASNPEKWFDYQNQLKALDAQMKSIYEKEIENYRSASTTQGSNNQAQNFLDQYTNSDKPSFATYSDLLSKGQDEIANNYWYGDGSQYYDSLNTSPSNQQESTPSSLSNNPQGENLGEIAAEYGGGAWKKQPQWLKDIEREYNKTKGQPLNPGTPKPGRGMGDTWNPLREAEAPSNTDYAVATALSGSDEQRQQQTFQAEFDPQKAQTASAAAKAYKKAASTEDPFRSQAAFG